MGAGEGVDDDDVGVSPSSPFSPSHDAARRRLPFSFPSGVAPSLRHEIPMMTRQRRPFLHHLKTISTLFFFSPFDTHPPPLRVKQTRKLCRQKRAADFARQAGTQSRNWSIRALKRGLVLRGHTRDLGAFFVSGNEE
ncbi:uncharacterized protein PV07_07452 [Cladophialophora immunda]|uniref:Uncharacterized protein n=1 Tax=Cladophialophora immunda TaxID=569365 RepID=A0A0D2ARK1_9EURO|nr:uncharacterized protein PV07_07452 [Cladophialophora immunda]KIW27742.1 hypothetical protein PV07_07452 [Cladophialophora immunda]